MSTVPYTVYGRILTVSYGYGHTRTRIRTVVPRILDGTVRELGFDGEDDLEALCVERAVSIADEDEQTPSIMRVE